MKMKRINDYYYYCYSDEIKEKKVTEVFNIGHEESVVDILNVERKRMEKALKHAIKRRRYFKIRLDDLEKRESKFEITLTKHAYFDYVYWDSRVDIYTSVLEGDFSEENY